MEVQVGELTLVGLEFAARDFPEGLLGLPTPSTVA